MKRTQKQAPERWGRRAETLTAWLLRRKGYVILERSLVTPAGEIDIVARRSLVLVIVEVKARQLLDMESIVSDRQRRRRRGWLEIGPDLTTMPFDLISSSSSLGNGRGISTMPGVPMTRQSQSAFEILAGPGESPYPVFNFDLNLPEK